MYVTPAEAARLRRDTPVNTFRLGNQEVKTKVFMYLPQGEDALEIDVLHAMWRPEE
jgi:hypothetical protein